MNTIKPYILAAIAFCALPLYAAAPKAEAESIKLTWLEIPDLVKRLKEFDGYDRIVEQPKDAEGKAQPPRVVQMKYDFSPQLRRSIARNIAALIDAYTALEATRQADLLKVSPGDIDKIKDDPVLNAKMVEMFGKHNSLEVKIERLSEDELSANPIAPSVLYEIRAILAPSK